MSSTNTDSKMGNMNRALTIESQYCLSANTTMPGPGVLMVSSNTFYSANSLREVKGLKREHFLTHFMRLV